MNNLKLILLHASNGLLIEEQFGISQNYWQFVLSSTPFSNELLCYFYWGDKTKKASLLAGF